MSHKFTGGFHFIDFDVIDEKLTDIEKYNIIVGWAGQARGINPGVFDTLTEWILDDSEWDTDDKLTDNRHVLKDNVITRFKEQTAKVYAYLKKLEPSGIVNTPVFKALNDFDKELSGQSFIESEAVVQVFDDFSIMRERNIREKIAGNKTGLAGTDSVDIFGYINNLKNCDAQVQWCLFMPDMVKNQQNGFKVESFEYKKMPAMRFIGRECIEHDENDMTWELEIMRTLDNMSEYKSGWDYDVFFMHHYGRGVDVEQWHGFWGRFMKENTPVPEGFVYFDFIPNRDINNFNAGTPYISQFAFATFIGDTDAIHKNEGYDSDAMYDVTRNIILGQGVNIPYPDKYWTAEVFPDGCDKYSSAYMFSVEI